MGSLVLRLCALNAYTLEKWKLEVYTMTDTFVEIDPCCDVCLEAVKEGTGAGQLLGDWPAAADGAVERYEVNLCRSCFLKVLSGLSRDRMLTGLFSEEPDDFRREDFGRLAAAE
ncbi:hypothetical protein [Pseudomonas sp. CFBP 13719]|uniref:hypothetical protein n=1 Tax=Pseudomonas sp. CFBP 13719 TaxID=2775303 RepID=UPI001FD25241|nr:hypothetical protein [Pseudomonas sp. CFBP 13719]